jgi:hypothetical protein
MSLYGEFLQDAKDMVADFGIDGMTFDTELTFKALVSDPVQTQVFQAGGYVEQTQHSVRLPAVTASWSLPDGSIGASGPTLGMGTPVAAFAIGKKVIVGGRNLRINGRTHKPGSAWITLVVIDDTQ